MALPHVPYAPQTSPQMSYLDDTFAAAAALGVIPTTASGSNAITLTLNSNTPTISAYSSFLLFSFVAANTSTGAVTVQVGSLAAVTLYTAGGTTQANTGDVSSGQLYVIGYNPNVGSGAGGFVILSSISSGSFVGGTLTVLTAMSGAAINEARTTIASASTTNIGAALANYLQVTGTTGINAFDTIQAGTERTLEFASSLVITNSASIICAGGQNITTYGGMVLKFRSEGSGNWRQVTPDPMGPPLPGIVGGLALSNDGGTPNTKIDMAAGFSVSDDFTVVMRSGAFTKTTGSWAVGTGNGGLDTGAVANSTWYHVYQIMRSDSGLVDFLISTSASAPTMPTNYTKKRRIGSFKTDGSAHIIAYTQYGNGNTRFYQWALRVADVSAATNSTANRTLLTLASSPLGVKVDALVAVQVTGVGAGANNVTLTSPDETDNTVLTDVIATGNTNSAAIRTLVRTNTSQQIGARGNVADTISIATIGWYDFI